MVIDISEYRHLRGEAVGFMDYLRADPLLDVDLDIERRNEPPRDVDLVS